MHHLRHKALEDLATRTPKSNPAQKIAKVQDVYGENVFGDRQLKSKLHGTSYEAFKRALTHGEPISAQVADEVAMAMKEWALSKGATHFTHWFQPLTGLTAEKHDSFISFKGGAYDRTLEVHFSGKQLIKGEPDASSFPSGGIRSTFEARGYTAWDMESPSFIRESPNGTFLCIPTAFASWTGEALDTKTPLLRSQDAISRSTVRLCQLLGNKDVTSAYSNCGIEQEFFLIDRGFYMARPDLLACGRTLLGRVPPKGQQMEDHYFGNMDRRVLSFIQDVEWRLWSLGVPTTTRHNEVAPSQYEMAPIFEASSVACDHNMLMMEVMKETAREHDFACLFHEKPFAGINGSGKHNNWSIATNTGENLFEPGNTPRTNRQFMVVLAALVRAVAIDGDLLRVAIAVPGNDFRLGANEAPPAIMSIYVGDLLKQVIDDVVRIEENTKKLKRQESVLLMGVKSLGKLPRDLSDRNRTSPFAFTGNKFEFRAVGSSQTCARPGMIMNVIMADSMEWICDEIEKELPLHTGGDAAENLGDAIDEVVTRTLRKYQYSVFNGNGYSQEWVEEAAKRGLKNLRTYPEAVEQLNTKKNIDLFARTKVFSAREVESQSHILYENYSKTVGIEAECLVHMIGEFIVPACVEYKKTLMDSCDTKDPVQAEYLDTYNKSLSQLMSALKNLKTVKTQALAFHEEQLHEQATFYRKEVMDSMLAARDASDSVESMVNDRLWPFPKYSEILFMK